MAVSEFLRDQLAAFKDAGCVKARATFEGGQCTSVEVEFPAAPVSATPFVDAEGVPVNLDAGAGPLTKDPDEDRQPQLESSDAAIERANFRKPIKAA